MPPLLPVATAAFAGKDETPLVKRASYDRLIQFQRSTPVDDGLAITEGPFINLSVAVPGRLKPAVGGERFANEQNVATAPSVFYFRWCPELADLTPADELVDAGVSFAIKAVTWDGRTNSEVEVAAVRKYGR